MVHCEVQLFRKLKRASADRAQYVRSPSILISIVVMTLFSSPVAFRYSFDSTDTCFKRWNHERCFNWHRQSPECVQFPWLSDALVLLVWSCLWVYLLRFRFQLVTFAWQSSLEPKAFHTSCIILSLFCCILILGGSSRFNQQELGQDQEAAFDEHRQHVLKSRWSAFGWNWQYLFSRSWFFSDWDSGCFETVRFFDKITIPSLLFCIRVARFPTQQEKLGKMEYTQIQWQLNNRIQNSSRGEN